MLLLFSKQSTFAQLPDSSIAPNWILPDTDGINRELYTYLNQGKTVFIDFFATWCVPCWNYHQTHAFLDLYKQHGPTGTLTQEVMCFAIEIDLNTHLLDLHGSTGGTQGNWMHLTKYPVLDLTSDTVSTQYDIHFIPLIYKICPDKRIFRLAQLSADDLYAEVASCSSTTSTENFDFQKKINVYPNPAQENLFIAGEGKFAVHIYNVLGECVWQNLEYQANSVISVKDFPKGMYFLHLSINDKKLIQKVMLGD